MMRLIKFKTVLSVGVLSLFVLTGLSQTAAAQGNSQWAHEKNRVRKEQKQYEKARKQAEKRYRKGQNSRTNSKKATCCDFDLREHDLAQSYHSGDRWMEFEAFSLGWS